MPLTIEDGSGVAGANSYATAAEATAYASARGLTLPSTDAEVEKLLVKASDFLLSIEDRFQGSRVSPSQALGWPRSDVYLFDAAEPMLPTLIPTQLKLAQCQLAVDLVDNDLQPTGTGREVVEETVGPLTTVYAKQGSGTVLPQPNKALALLAPLFRKTPTLRTLRV